MENCSPGCKNGGTHGDSRSARCITSDCPSRNARGDRRRARRLSRCAARGSSRFARRAVAAEHPGRRVVTCHPAILVGRAIEYANIDEDSGELRCTLSDGSRLDIKPAEVEDADDPPYWELISPAGVVLEFGPRVRWQISSADAQPKPRR